MFLDTLTTVAKGAAMTTSDIVSDIVESRVGRYSMMALCGILSTLGVWVASSVQSHNTTLATITDQVANLNSTGNRIEGLIKTQVEVATRRFDSISIELAKDENELTRLKQEQQDHEQADAVAQSKASYQNYQSSKGKMTPP